MKTPWIVGAIKVDKFNRQGLPFEDIFDSNLRQMFLNVLCD